VTTPILSLQNVKKSFGKNHVLRGVTLDVAPGHRFPLTYIMEAADDISYLTADLEDSVEKGILNLDQVYDLIKTECEKEGERYLLDVIQKRYEQAKKNDEPYQFNMFFTLVRANLVTDLVKHVAGIYLDNHEAIFEGSFNAALLDFVRGQRFRPPSGNRR
jgi:dGTPase